MAKHLIFFILFIVLVFSGALMRLENVSGDNTLFVLALLSLVSGIYFWRKRRVEE